MSSEQKALLESRSFGFRPLATSGHLNLWKVFEVTLQPLFIFLFALIVLILPARFNNAPLLNLVWGVGLFVMLIFPTVALIVLAAGIISMKIKSRVKWPAVIYWTWWPLWRWVMCVVAACFATQLGNFFWFNQFMPYAQLNRLQAYREVNPATVSGVRLQDAGMITFNASVGVDRSRIGCIKNGATWCVAPVVNGGQIPVQNSNGEHYDLFVAGVDCCTCPGEFRCGDWNQPGAFGGYRVLNEQNRRFFQLASEDFATTYGKEVRHAIFFEMVSDPLAVYHELWGRGLQLIVLTFICVPFAFFSVALVLNGLLKFLYDRGVAEPVDAPMPPPGLGRALSAHLLPKMYNHYMKEQEQQTAWLNNDPKYVIL